MGSGKTTFIKYFIQNASNINCVPSPSYNLMLPYYTKQATIYHMDVWRLKDSHEAISLGITELFDGIFLIEGQKK